MRFDAKDISPQLRAMLARVDRSELAEGGFDIDDDAFLESRRMAGDPDQAIFHCLFNRAAPHAGIINPLPPPEATSSNDEMARWVVAKQAEIATLQAASVRQLADQVSAAVVESGGSVSAHVDALKTTSITTLRSIAEEARGVSEQQTAGIFQELGRMANMGCAHLQRLDGHVLEGSALVSASISAARQIAAKQEAGMLSALGEMNESIRAVAVEINESAGRRSGQILGALESAAEAGRNQCERLAGAIVCRWKREDDAAELREKSATIWRRVHAVLLALILIALLAGRAHAQGGAGASVVQGIGAPGAPQGRVLTVQGDPNGSALPVKAAAGTALIGQVAASGETATIYNGTAALAPKFAVITASSSGATTIVAAVTSKRIRVLSVVVMVNAAVNIKFQSHVTPTDLTGLLYCAANGGFAPPWAPTGMFQTVAGEALDINLSGAVAVGGWLTYVEI